MTSSSERAEQLLDEAFRAPPGSRTRTELLVEAAEHADASDDRDLAFHVHEVLATAGFESGAIDRALSAFSYCLSLCDDAPDRFAEEDLHWRYKWVLEWVPQFPEVSRATIDELLTDLTRRFAKGGSGADAVRKIRTALAFQLGDPELRARYDEWTVSARDHLSDCEVCDASFDIEVLLALGETERGLARVEDLLAKGRSCAEVPHVTFAAVLPHLAADDPRRRPFHERGFALLRGNAKLVGPLGVHLAMAGLLEDPGGMRALRESLPVAALHPSAGARLDYLLGAEVLVHHVGREQGQVLITLPPELGGDGARRTWEASALEAALAAASAPIVAAFDARNGNDAISRRAARMRSLASLAPGA